MTDLGILFVVAFATILIVLMVVSAIYGKGEGE